MPPLSKKQALRDLSMYVQACVKCPYSSTRDAPLIGNGEYRSPILVVGPTTRKRDDEEGEVFAGRAGKKLDRMLRSAELDISKVYRTNLVRCYAGRDPKFGEFSAFKRCQSHTVQLIKLMRPIAIVVCGLKAFKWLIVKWTSEVVDEHSFYKWCGRAVRLKEIWGDRKFFIIESPTVLSNASNPEAQAKSIELLAQMKAYVVSHQKGEPIALEMTDLKKRTRNANRQQQTFGWS